MAGLPRASFPAVATAAAADGIDAAPSSPPAGDAADTEPLDMGFAVVPLSPTSWVPPSGGVCCAAVALAVVVVAAAVAVEDDSGLAAAVGLPLLAATPLAAAAAAPAATAAAAAAAVAVPVAVPVAVSGLPAVCGGSDRTGKGAKPSRHETLL